MVRLKYVILVMADQSPLFSLTAIYKTYRQGAITTPALSDVSLRVETGAFVAVMGPSGCGKSTLLNVLGLLDGVDAGQYQFGGDDVTRLSETAQDRLRRHHIGVVFQNFNLIPALSVWENVELPLLWGGLGAAERRRRVGEALERLNLLHRRYHRPAALSGGQQQRVAIARAVITRPRLLLADEPTGNLDSVNRQSVMRLLSDLNEEGTTIVMVTHAEGDARYAHRIARMQDGHLQP